ncbi:putative aminotransferase [Aspergillus sclerotioniger CBS 115572]|uniref:Putative aminotransferase n=1 Tax=Aspergillus sclerotioniger CBS 115572 TaxID=1450535 RepID=A0A317WU82_9EURO|nr:putative aminotransferase [Aspergillus sclerotioniger CBS 115572]PWY89645.1 putative aminotransferase [Aspergillus sclerotioniger CBS 115572]
MPQISDFAVERWMDDHETTATHNLAETCCASISLTDLVSLSQNTISAEQLLNPTTKQTYGAIRGSEALRSNIANLYSPSPITKDNILVTNGGIAANFLALYSLVKPGDHVIVQYPTYQQLYSLPRSLGAEVSLWRSDEKNGWEVNVDELRSLVTDKTKLIIINNPQNPTGAILPHSILNEIISIAKDHGLTILSDEVYRPLFHSTSTPPPPSLLTFNYPKTLVTSSTSKAYSLAGLRTGWLASPSTEILDLCASVRHYTTISVSRIDDHIASLALSQSTVNNILERNIALAKGNLEILSDFVDEFSWAVKWTKPVAGTTAFLKFVDRNGRPVNDEVFCSRLMENMGVLVVPGGGCFGNGRRDENRQKGDFAGYVRIGYVCEREELVEGLKALRKFMAEEYEKLPVMMDSE